MKIVGRYNKSKIKKILKTQSKHDLYQSTFTIERRLKFMVYLEKKRLKLDLYSDILD